MSKAILIIGLPGSGKTYLAINKYVPLGYFLIDDPTVIPNDATLRLNKVVITDPNLCNETVRLNCIKFFETAGFSVECVYFENDEEKCKKLISARNDGRRIETFKAFKYTIPKGIEPMKIYELPKKEEFFSICSAHREPVEGCPRCKVGHWKTVET